MHAGITLLVAGTTESVPGASMELFARLFDTSTCERGTDLLFWVGAFNPKALESSVKLTERPTRTSHRPPPFPPKKHSKQNMTASVTFFASDATLLDAIPTLGRRGSITDHGSGI